MKIRHIKELRKDDSGATAIEYGLIAALVSVAAIGAVNVMGGAEQVPGGGIEGGGLHDLLGSCTGRKGWRSR